MLSIHELYKVEFSDGVKGALGIDERGKLYWRGEPVVTQLQVWPPWWIGVAAVVAGLSLVVIATSMAWIAFGPLVV